MGEQGQGVAGCGSGCCEQAVSPGRKDDMSLRNAAGSCPFRAAEEQGWIWARLQRAGAGLSWPLAWSKSQAVGRDGWGGLVGQLLGMGEEVAVGELCRVEVGGCKRLGRKQEGS